MPSYAQTYELPDLNKWMKNSGGARGHPERGSSFPDRGAEVSAGSTLPYKLPPTSSHCIYCEVEAQLTSCMHISMELTEGCCTHEALQRRTRNLR